MNEFLELEEKIVSVLKTVYDPEIPVDIYELGLVYNIDVNDNGIVNIDMTLTAPNCPAGEFIIEDVKQKVEGIEGVTPISSIGCKYKIIKIIRYFSKILLYLICHKLYSCRIISLVGRV